MKVHLTYSIVTEESADYGDHAYHGFVTREKGFPRKYGYIPKRPALFTLRDAVSFLEQNKQEGPIEADSYPVSLTCPPRWFTANAGWQQRDGRRESIQVSLHLPKSVSPSSALRIARYLRCYGAR